MIAASDARTGFSARAFCAAMLAAVLMLVGIVVGILLLLTKGDGVAIAALPPPDPARVVSINLCTDQQAMLLAAPGQLLSVSALAADPAVSAMADKADEFRLNYGRAEEIFLMKPDLVLAGTYTTRQTVELLKRLDIPVAEFAPETSLADVSANLLRMGRLLGREAEAERLIGEMTDGLLALEDDVPAGDKTAALYYANGYTSGDNTLAGDIVAKAGLNNIGVRAGVDGLGRLPLERLVMAAPDVIIGGDDGYDALALATAVFAHPAFKAVRAQSDYVTLASNETICGGPANLQALARLKQAVSGSE